MDQELLQANLAEIAKLIKTLVDFAKSPNQDPEVKRVFQDECRQARTTAEKIPELANNAPEATNLAENVRNVVVWILKTVKANQLGNAEEEHKELLLAIAQFKTSFREVQSLLIENEEDSQPTIIRHRRTLSHAFNSVTRQVIAPEQQNKPLTVQSAPPTLTDNLESDSNPDSSHKNTEKLDTSSTLETSATLDTSANLDTSASLDASAILDASATLDTSTTLDNSTNIPFMPPPTRPPPALPITSAPESPRIDSPTWSTPRRSHSPQTDILARARTGGESPNERSRRSSRDHSSIVQIARTPSPSPPVVSSIARTSSSPIKKGLTGIDVSQARQSILSGDVGSVLVLSPKRSSTPRADVSPAKKRMRIPTDTPKKRTHPVVNDSNSDIPRKKKSPSLGDAKRATSAFFPKIGIKSKSIKQKSSDPNGENTDHPIEHARTASATESINFRSITTKWRETRRSMDEQKLLNDGLDAERRLEEIIDMIRAQEEGEGGVAEPREEVAAVREGVGGADIGVTEDESDLEQLLRALQT